MFNKILIVTKDSKSRGGVANYYRLFFKKFKSDDFEIEWFYVGSRAKQYEQRQKRNFGYLVQLVGDLWKLRRKLRRDSSVRIVQVNPSLIPVPLIRDGLIILLARLYKKRVVVFFRGWKEEMVLVLCRKSIRQKIFLTVYKKADKYILLADSFAKQLKTTGLDPKKMVVSRTMFDEDEIIKLPSSIDTTLQFLFLSRISHEKGVFEIIDAVGALHKKGIECRVAFHGHESTAGTINQLRQIAESKDIEHLITFGDYLKGEEKYKAYACSDVFLLPSHHEGCPNSVLEAMASGCFVICTDVGALSEVVQDVTNGRFVRIGDSKDLIEKLAWCMENKSQVRQCGKDNRQYAFNHFEANKIINQIISIYEKLSYV